MPTSMTSGIICDCFLFGSLSFQLVDVDVIAGLDMMIQRGQWEKAIETAEQQVRDVTLLD